VVRGEGGEENRLHSWWGGKCGAINAAQRFSWRGIIKVEFSRLSTRIIESFDELTNAEDQSAMSEGRGTPFH
jgi:hypothetical protein